MKTSGKCLYDAFTTEKTNNPEVFNCQTSSNYHLQEPDRRVCEYVTEREATQMWDLFYALIVLVDV